MAVPHAVADIDEIQMRVDLDDVDRAPGKGADAGDVDRMVAAQHHRHGSRSQDGADPGLDIRVAGLGVGVDDVGIADVHDPHALQIGHVIFVVIGPGMAEGKQGRGLADAPWPEPRPGAPLGAKVEGRAHDGEIGVDLRPIRLVGVLAEGRDSDKRQVQPPAFIAMAHGASP